MAEMIISIVVVTICVLPLFVIGIVQYRSENPVGFWSGKEPPKSEQLTDVKAYNRKHGVMWMVYAAGFLLCFWAGIPFGGNVMAVAAMIECFGGLFIMIWYHNRLERKYLKQFDKNEN
jgi:hypothetical protein